MLNKNDPLIGAVQEVMKRNQAEREAAKIVNEAFGVTDRKALPHERQGEWDAAYKTVLSEGVEALDEETVSTKLDLTDHGSPIHAKHEKEFGITIKHPEDGKGKSTVSGPKKSMQGYLNRVYDTGASPRNAHPHVFSETALDEKVKMSKDDIAALRHPKKKITSHDFAALRAGEHKMEEMKTDPYAQQQAGSVETIKPKPTSVTPADQSQLKSKIQSIMKEAKTNPYAIGMAAVQKSTGDKPPMEKKNIMKAHKIAKKIDEGFNNRHNSSVNASASKQVVAEIAAYPGTPAGFAASSRSNSMMAAQARMKAGEAAQARLAAQRSRATAASTTDVAPRPQSGATALARQQSGDTAPRTQGQASPMMGQGAPGIKNVPGGARPAVVAKNTATGTQASTGAQIGGARPSVVAKNTATGQQARMGGNPTGAPSSSALPKKVVSTGNPNVAGSGGNVGTPPKPTLKPRVDARAQGAKVGGGVATKKSPVAAPADAQKKPMAIAKKQTARPSAQRARFNRQIDRGNAAPGTRYKGLGITTGTTIQQKAAPQVKRPVGTGK